MRASKLLVVMLIHSPSDVQTKIYFAPCKIQTVSLRLGGRTSRLRPRGEMNSHRRDRMPPHSLFVCLAVPRTRLQCKRVHPHLVEVLKLDHAQKDSAVGTVLAALVVVATRWYNLHRGCVNKVVCAVSRHFLQTDRMPKHLPLLAGSNVSRQNAGIL